MTDDTDDSNVFVLSWDCYGLESCINVSDIEKAKMWNILANTNEAHRYRSIDSLLNSMMLRAQVNPQRHYEIYAIDVANGVTADDIVEMFNNDPQGSSDLIRSRGRQLYSNRREPASKIKIV